MYELKQANFKEQRKDGAGYMDSSSSYHPEIEEGRKHRPALF